VDRGQPNRVAGDGVALRPWRPQDAAAVAPMRDDPVVRRWSSLPHGVDAWLERQRSKPDGVSFALTGAGDDRAVGKMALGHLDLDARHAELSYWVLPAARGRGLAARGARTLAAWGFEALGLRAVLLDIDVDNAPSRRVAEALGARPRDAPHVETDRNGVPRELLVYELRPSG
jgi:RimJ/RimL family protein N-acetyltransferase